MESPWAAPSSSGSSSGPDLFPPVNCASPGVSRPCLPPVWAPGTRSRAQEPLVQQAGRATPHSLLPPRPRSLFPPGGPGPHLLTPWRTARSLRPHLHLLGLPLCPGWGLLPSAPAAPPGAALRAPRPREVWF